MDIGCTRSADEVLATLQELVAIKSVNPAYEDGEIGERYAIEYMAHFFESLGLVCEYQEVAPGRNNVIAHLPGRDETRAVVLESHLDTASALNFSESPFVPDIKEGRLYGRGSCDTKATAAAMMHAVKRMVDSRQKPACSVYVAGVVDEEYSMSGSRKLAEWLAHKQAEGVQFRGIVVSEPTGLVPVVAQKGVVHFAIEMQGKAAHGAYPQLGHNAIVQMAKVVTALNDHFIPGLRDRTAPLVGAATLNIGMITGGMQANAVPATCELLLDRRTIPGEDPDEAYRELSQFINSTTGKSDGFTLNVKQPVQICSSVSTDPNNPFVQDVLERSRNYSSDTNVAGVAFATDASQLQHLDIPIVVLGAGSITQAHTEREYVECEQVLQAAELFQGLIS